mmetsp:Transcript_14260/g.44314  ORF Transcript_14260/g.44314 Transcript_14260/m.44314 type:complete len:276 (-) Transcript_14260:181-1008(-)
MGRRRVRGEHGDLQPRVAAHAAAGAGRHATSPGGAHRGAVRSERRPRVRRREHPHDDGAGHRGHRLRPAPPAARRPALADRAAARRHDRRLRHVVVLRRRGGPHPGRAAHRARRHQLHAGQALPHAHGVVPRAAHGRHVVHRHRRPRRLHDQHRRPRPRAGGRVLRARPAVHERPAAPVRRAGDAPDRSRARTPGLRRYELRDADAASRRGASPRGAEEQPARDAAHVAADGRPQASVPPDHQLLARARVVARGGRTRHRRGHRGRDGGLHDWGR